MSLKPVDKVVDPENMDVTLDSLRLVPACIALEGWYVPATAEGSMNSWHLEDVPYDEEIAAAADGGERPGAVDNWGREHSWLSLQRAFAGKWVFQGSGWDLLRIQRRSEALAECCVRSPGKWIEKVDMADCEYLATWKCEIAKESHGRDDLANFRLVF